MAIETVDVAMKNGDFHSYVSLPGVRVIFWAWSFQMLLWWNSQKLRNWLCLVWGLSFPVIWDHELGTYDRMVLQVREKLGRGIAPMFIQELILLAHQQRGCGHWPEHLYLANGQQRGIMRRTPKAISNSHVMCTQTTKIVNEFKYIQMIGFTFFTYLPGEGL